MIFRYIIGLFLFYMLVFSSCTHEPEVLELSEGWAKTSVNTAIFRKNSVVSDEEYQYAAWYDSSGHVIVAKRLLGKKDWTIRQTPMRGSVYDAHNVISIMVDGDGYLHLAWDHHDGPLNYCRSKSPGAFEFTERLDMTDSLEDDGVTYPEFYRLPDGDLLFAYRHGASGKGNLVLNRYSTDEKRWKRVHKSLIDGEGERNAYWQMCVDNAGTIHLSWVWRETWDVATNHDLCYARSYDGGETWMSGTGEFLHIPITAATAGYALKIPQGSDLINQTSIYADNGGRPFITSYWKPEGDSVPQFFVVYLDDREWKVSRVTNRQMPFSLSGGGSRRIPVSRPQVLFSESNQTIHVIFRDRELNNRICVASARLNEQMNWKINTIPDIDVGQWEPTYDTELWKREEKLHLFVQKVGQGAGNENPEDMPPQMVKLLMLNEF